MSSILRKLKSKKGESLVESLCAILIFTMASIVLFSMVSAAGDINGKAKEQDLKNQQQMVAVEKGTNKTGSGSVTVTMNGTTVATVSVDVYGGVDEAGAYDEDIFRTFFVTPPSEPSGG